MKTNTETGRMRTVKIIVSQVKEIQIPEDVYVDGQYEGTTVCTWTNPRWDRWQEAINEIGRIAGYDLNPEDGGEWFAVRNIAYEGAFEGVIAILNEEDEIMAEA